MGKRLSTHSRVVAVRDQVSADLSGETAILHLGSGVYYGLDAVGRRVWASLQRPKRVGEILEGLVAEYDVDPQRCRQDLLGLLEQLLTEKLIEIKA